MRLECAIWEYGLGALELEGRPTLMLNDWLHTANVCWSEAEVEPEASPKNKTEANQKKQRNSKHAPRLPSKLMDGQFGLELARRIEPPSQPNFQSASRKSLECRH